MLPKEPLKDLDESMAESAGGQVINRGSFAKYVKEYSLPKGLLDFARWLRDETDHPKELWVWAYFFWLEANDPKAFRRYCEKCKEEGK